MSRLRFLTTDEQAWAYQKWCEGYTQTQIADALLVSVSTVGNMLREKKRIRPTLVYPGNARSIADQSVSCEKCIHNAVCRGHEIIYGIKQELCAQYKEEIIYEHNPSTTL